MSSEEGDNQIENNEEQQQSEEKVENSEEIKQPEKKEEKTIKNSFKDDLWVFQFSF